MESVLQIYDHRLSFDIATEFSTGRFHGISNEEDIHRAHVGKNVRGEGKRLEKQSFVLYNRYSLYNAVFNYRGKCARNTAHGNDLVVFLLLLLFFLAHLLSILEIQTETTMNHVLIDSTRDPLLLPFRLHRR